MKTRICYQERVNAGTPKPCTREDWNRMLDDEKVAQICARIAALDENDPEYENKKGRLKKKLPVLVPHACGFSPYPASGTLSPSGAKGTTTGGPRKSELAIPSGLVMLDVDHVDDPRAWWENKKMIQMGTVPKCITFEKMLCDEHVYLVAITPSGKGLRIIGERQPKESIEVAQMRLAKALGIEVYDGVTKDLARASYMMPRAYVLWVYEEWLCEWPSEEVEKWWTSGEITTQGQCGEITTQMGQPCGEITTQMGQTPRAFSDKQSALTGSDPRCSNLSEQGGIPAADRTLREDRDKGGIPAADGTLREDGELCYKDVPYQDIVEALLVVTGNAGGAIQGERNTVYFTLCNNMRYICDFDAELMLRVLPDFGLGVDERRAAIRSSLGRPRRDNIPVTMQSAITMAEQSMTTSKTEEVTRGMWDVNTLEMPAMPPLLRLLCSRMPEAYHAPLVMSSLPLMGTLATRTRFEYLDGQVQSPSFFTICAAPAASGKSFIRKPFELLKVPLKEHDAISEEAEREYLKKKAAAKNSKNQPEDPEVYYRIQPVNISIAKYLQQASRAKDLHLYSEAEEMDTLVKSESRGAWSQKSDLYRVGFDNQEYGQSYMNTDFSCSATVRVYYNLYVSGTPKSMERFFKDIENGLATRVSVVQLPDTTYCDMPHFGSYTEKEQEQIIGWARKLNAAEGMLRSSEVDEAIRKWLDEKLQQAIDADSRAADVFRRRAAVIGWRAGMLSTLLYEGKEAGKQAAAFAVYAAEYTFRAQMNMWGERMEQEIAAADDINNSRGEATALLSRLPQEFTTQMLIALRSKAGQSVKPTAISNLIGRWKKLGRISKLSNGLYKRLR